MTSANPTVPKLDRLVHEPARLAIMSVLSEVEHVDFNYLLVALNLSRGNLSSHLAKLSDVGYVAVKKRFIGNVPNTSYVLTARGAEALEAYWRELDALRAGALSPSEPEPVKADRVRRAEAAGRG